MNKQGNVKVNPYWFR